MPQGFRIVSGANAGRPGPLRATSGCECWECEVFRAVRREEARERYWSDPAHRVERLAHEAERLADPAAREAKNEQARERYASDKEYRESRKRSAWEYGRRPEVAKKKRERAKKRYRELRDGSVRHPTFRSRKPDAASCHHMNQDAL